MNEKYWHQLAKYLNEKDFKYYQVIVVGKKLLFKQIALMIIFVT